MRARGQDESGQISLLVIGFAFVLLMGVAAVVDATAAYLHRSGLNTLADGAALTAADRAGEGEQVYTDGLGGERLRLTEATARGAVQAYLQQVGAYAEYPGLAVAVSVAPGSDEVTVELRAPLDLPLSIPGSPGGAVVGATGSAVASIG
ncbi:pilus assembly protein TadG-related protein [Nocardioides sp. Leaf307]|uniref:pilus assembly protein TadG-related protein n=1 Tax=Nocardioides sp. Leaf307 TaxID=1736331 RepID=UPI00070240D5|nr:pilus assembly protein TadG-related protein [Nocardioides sp. Leaf307]KQQ43094.1 hypothetical protein ASF50_03620 [Nocardioides sp. Leaf307]